MFGKPNSWTNLIPFIVYDRIHMLWCYYLHFCHKHPCTLVFLINIVFFPSDSSSKLKIFYQDFVVSWFRSGCSLCNRQIPIELAAVVSVSDHHDHHHHHHHHHHRNLIIFVSYVCTLCNVHWRYAASVISNFPVFKLQQRKSDNSFI